MMDLIAKILTDYEDRIIDGASSWKSVAAVLVPLYLDGGELGVILIRRTASERIHGGQMGFPGGMVQENDGPDLLQTALRETEEELGILPSDVGVLGKLSVRNTVVSRILVAPFVGSIPWPYLFTPDPSEVQSVHRSSVRDLLRTQVEAEMHFDFPPPVYQVDDQPVWGLTARILNEFSEVIGAAMKR